MTSIPPPIDIKKYGRNKKSKGNRKIKNGVFLITSCFTETVKRIEN